MERWEADLLQDSCSLSGACSQHFFWSPLALVIIWSQRVGSRPRSLFLTWQEAEKYNSSGGSSSCDLPRSS